MFRRIFPAILLVLLFAHPAALRAATKPNIVLVTLSSSRADRMGFLGAKAKLTPNLDGLARQSMVFEQAYSQAPLTVVSHATILSGTYPQTHRVTEFGARLAPTVPFVPDLLHAHGYRTAAFVGSIALDPKNGLAPGFDRGFNLYEAGFQPRQLGETSSVERSAAQGVARAKAWLTRNPAGPFFLWLHLNGPQDASATTYNTAVTAVDAAVGQLIAVLRAAKLFDDALIVVASDHGESLGAHGEEAHGVFLYDETIHVPLFLKLPQNQSAGRRVAARARLVDVAPTILEIAGVPVPAQMQGQSLLRIAKANVDQPVYSISNFPQQAFGWSALESWRAGKYLYIKAPKPELYDLSADPGATRNLAQASKATLETIASQLDAFDRRLSDSGNATVSSELTSSEMQKLASLGYVGLQKSNASVSAAASGFDPKDGIATANKISSALALLNEGKSDRAVAVLQPVLGDGAKMYLLQFVMGAALARQQKYPRAIEYLRRAIELQPDSTWAHYEMGYSLLRTGDYKAAVIHLEIASSRLPDFAEAHSLLAQAYEHLGRAEDAKRERSKSTAPEGAKL